MTITLKRTLQISVSLLLAFAILFWLYRDFPFAQVQRTLLHEVHWNWMLFSLVFGILPQILRGVRWRMALEPLGEKPRMRNCISAIYLSFAASLIIPRIGEISRCATLKKTDGTSFPIALGTVVTERIVDSLLVLLILAATFLYEIPTFTRFFKEIGFSAESITPSLTRTNVLIALCALLLLIGICFFLFKKHAKLQETVQGAFKNFVQGLASIRKVQSPTLYLLYSIAIWGCYFLHFWLAFFAFDFTSSIGIRAALIAFCMVTVACLMPTPNGAGPWHFAVKTVLMQFGVSAYNAVLFPLIVHALQTLLVILLGVYGYFTLQWKHKS